MSINELTVLVISPEEVIYEGTVINISSLNEKGKFDILPLHANFITIIKKTLILREKSGQNKEIQIDNGIIRVMENQVYIFLGIETQQSTMLPSSQ